MEQRDIEGIEDWRGSTIAQPSWKWSREIQYRRNRRYSRLDPCTAWFEVEQREMEGIETLSGLTLAHAAWLESERVGG